MNDDGKPQGDDVDVRIAALLRRVPDPMPLSPARLHRVAARIDADLRGEAAGPRELPEAVRGPWAGPPRQVPRRPPLRGAIVALLLVGGAGVGFAQPAVRAALHAAIGTVLASARRLWTPGDSAPLTGPAPVVAAAGPSAVPPSAPSARVRAASTKDMPPAATLEPPSDQAAVRPPRARPPRPTVRKLALAPRRPADGSASCRGAACEGATDDSPAEAPAARATALLPEPDRSPLKALGLGQRPAALAPAPGEAAARPHRGARLADEAALLREAMQSLRHDDDPAGALDRIDEYDVRFPFGLLRSSAALVRLDAWLALGRRDEAHRLLETLDLAGSPRAAELMVVRGELRSPRDCAGAVADFSRALARDPAPAIAARARRGRAACHDQLGNRSAAEADRRTIKGSR